MQIALGTSRVWPNLGGNNVERAVTWNKAQLEAADIREASASSAAVCDRCRATPEPPNELLRLMRHKKLKISFTGCPTNVC